MPNRFVEVREAFERQSPEPFQITPTLWLYADQYVENLRYRNALPLLLQHGRRYKARPYIYPVHALLGDRCYDKAYEFAMQDDNLLYCEGFLCYKETERVLAHGWCMTRDRRIVDPTLYAHQDAPGLTYYGFPLRKDYVTEWSKQHGYLGLLDGHKDGLQVGIHHAPYEYWLEPVEWGNDE